MSLQDNINHAENAKLRINIYIDYNINTVINYYWDQCPLCFIYIAYVKDNILTNNK